MMLLCYVNINGIIYNMPDLLPLWGNTSQTTPPTSAEIEAILEVCPSEAVVRYSGILKPGTVLDVGSGAGRNTFHLLRSGFDVTSLDVSPDALARLDGHANVRGLSIAKKVLANIVTYEPVQPYDNMLAIFALRFLSHEQFRLVMSKMMGETVVSGVHIIQDLTKNGQLDTSHPSMHWPASGELPELYEQNGWSVLSYEEKVVPTAVPDSSGSVLFHEAATLVAQKVG